MKVNCYQHTSHTQLTKIVTSDTGNTSQNTPYNSKSKKITNSSSATEGICGHYNWAWSSDLNQTKAAQIDHKTSECPWQYTQHIKENIQCIHHTFWFNTHQSSPPGSLKCTELVNWMKYHVTDIWYHNSSLKFIFTPANYPIMCLTFLVPSLLEKIYFPKCLHCKPPGTFTHNIRISFLHQPIQCQFARSELQNTHDLDWESYCGCAHQNQSQHLPASFTISVSVSTPFPVHSSWLLGDEYTYHIPNPKHVSP